jgi:hypothetical protein
MGRERELPLEIVIYSVFQLSKVLHTLEKGYKQLQSSDM